jgi:hypothetical protein
MNKKTITEDLIKAPYKYAAVNQNSTAFISTHKPKLKKECWTPKKGNIHYLGDNFDNSNWNKNLLKKC